jgi:RNA methyltransferase, TrmH family
MESIQKIESPQNPRVKAAVKLRKRSARKAEQATLVEGYREILRAHESGWTFHEIYYCPELMTDGQSVQLINTLQATGTPLFECSNAAFSKMAYRETTDGLLARSPLVGRKLSDLILPENPLILIAEDLEKPGNLGTILRTADAAGVDAVIACDANTDLNNPNVIRASIGTLFYLPIAEATTEETLAWLAKQQIQSVAAMPDAALNYTQVNMRTGTAIVVGAEDTGLSAQWKSAASHQVSIPMLGRNDSLNVSTAAAIILYEAVRQRSL